MNFIQDFRLLVAAGFALVLLGATSGHTETTNESAAAVSKTESPVVTGDATTKEQVVEQNEDGILKDFDSLGGNNVLLEKAKLLNPETKVEVVQDRIVDRRNRFEIAPEFGATVGGDSYNSTNGAGLNVHYHINPYISFGAKYMYHTNALTNEGRNLLANEKIVPDLDWPKSQALALINVYPIYGKLNFFNAGVVHFDVYAVAGGGLIELRRGQSTTYTGGLGLGLWLSQHLTTRLEVRYQGYQANWLNTDVQMDTTVTSVQIGYLL